MKNILVPIDFSEAGNNAFRFALDLAARYDGTLKVVHVYHPIIDEEEAYLFNQIRFASLEDAEEMLDSFIAEEMELAAEGGVRVAVQVKKEIIVGFPVEEILRLSQSPDVDCIVLGTTGERGFMKNLFGSASTNVAQHSKCPVLLVPHGVAFHGFQHILYANDYEAAEALLLQKLMEFANLFHADIHFVHVQTKDKPDDFEEIKNHLQDALCKCKEPLFSFTTSKINGHSVAEGLNDYALRHRIDLVVMARPNRDFWENMFHKNTTKAMALNTRLPILILHGETVLNR